MTGIALDIVTFIPPGTTVTEAARLMCDAAREAGGPVAATFNGIPLLADESTTPAEVVAQWDRVQQVQQIREESRRQKDKRLLEAAGELADMMQRMLLMAEPAFGPTADEARALIARIKGEQ